jgi:hypothetical protein
VISTLVIAALSSPLRVRLQAFIDRRFYRTAYNAEQMLTDFAAVARDEVDIERLVGAMGAAVSESLQPQRLNLWIREKDKVHD